MLERWHKTFVRYREGGIQLMLALVVWPLTTHSSRDGCGRREGMVIMLHQFHFLVCE